jgi:putative transposase
LGSAVSKHHNGQEIANILRRADEYVARGQKQSQFCKTLGISVMTYHRWRKQAARTGAPVSASASNEAAVSVPAGVSHRSVDEIRLENRRLRQIITDLLLEKARLEEMLQARDKRQG